MDAKAKSKALFRSKLREASQKKEKRIDSPLVRYNEYDQPVCRVCNVVLKSDSLWPAHQASRKHHEAIENVKAAAAGMSKDNNINKVQQVEVQKPRSSSTLPENFFDNQRSNKRKSDASADLRHKKKESSNIKIVEEPESSKNPNMLVSDDSVERKEETEMMELDQPSKKTEKLNRKRALPGDFFDDKERNDGQTVSQLSQALTNMSHLEAGHVKEGLSQGTQSAQVKGALPEGFFDNKDADLRARGIKPVKIDINDAYKEFEKEIQDDLQQVDARLEEEEIDAANTGVEIESLVEKEYREMVEMAKQERMKKKAEELARGKKSPAFRGKESSDESSSDEEDDDDGFAVDWRAKHM